MFVQRLETTTMTTSEMHLEEKTERNKERKKENSISQTLVSFIRNKVPQHSDKHHQMHGSARC